MERRFRVGIADGFFGPDGKPTWGDIGLHLLEQDPRMDWALYAPTRVEVRPEDLSGFDGVVALGERYTRESFVGIDRLLAIGRFGVGYDRIDVQACTEADVALFVTPSGVRRPVASSALALILSLSMKMPQKALYSRTGEHDRVNEQIGIGLIGRTLGSIGVGNIGRELFRLAAPLEMRFLASDPYASQGDLDSLGVRLVPFDALLAESDILCLNCPLTSETRHIVDAASLARMKPSAILVNTARGELVDTDALVEALASGRIAGAGLDVTDPEPLPVGHPLLRMDNVIVTSHRLCFTDQLVQGIGYADMEGMRALARGEAPSAVVNRDVLGRPGFRAKLDCWRG